uniref:Cep192-like domain-containing protein n=1 Tax=Ditylenchus dipsaci TaxID=166011 RepID=A0A915DJR5_9BILA
MTQPRRALWQNKIEQGAASSSSTFPDEDLAKLSVSIAENGGPAVSTPKHGDENRPPIFDRRFEQFSRIGSPTNSISSNRFHFNKANNGDGELRVYLVLNVMDHKLVNHSGEQLRLRYSLGSDPSCFKIDSVSSLVVRPDEELVISIRYTPIELDQNSNVLFIERINGDYQKYSFKLLGYGGKAIVHLTRSLYDNGTAQDTPSGVIVLTPDFFPPFPSSVVPRCNFELVNDGDRSAFISIQAVDRQGQLLPCTFVSIQPSRFVLAGKKNLVQKISVKIDEKYNENARRESGVSLASAIPLVDGCGVRLVVIWGEELQRTRFKNWQGMRNDVFMVQGQNFGEVFAGEDRSADKTTIPFIDRPFDHEGDEFKDSVRMIKMNVIDNRAIRLFPAACMRDPNEKW